MQLVKYQDAEMTAPIWFWTNNIQFQDGSSTVEKQVSETFSTEEEALEWGKTLKNRLEENHND